MELKVWVEGIQRIVCGVSDATTCQDVVYALAHATGKTGRFTLVEKWRNNERLLPPQEHPLKVLSKWGEYANDVQLVLRRSSLDSKAPVLQNESKPVQGENPISWQRVGSPLSPSSAGRDLKKSLTFSAGGSITSTTADSGAGGCTKDKFIKDMKEATKISRNNNVQPVKKESNEKKMVKSYINDDIKETNSQRPSGKVLGERESILPISRFTVGPNTRNYNTNYVAKTLSAKQQLTSASRGIKNEDEGSSQLQQPKSSPPSTDQFLNADHFSSSGGLATTSRIPTVTQQLNISKASSQESSNNTNKLPSLIPVRRVESRSTSQDENCRRANTSTYPVPVHVASNKAKKNELKRDQLDEEAREEHERVVYDNCYRDLVRLINLQREKLSQQQAGLTQFDAEIMFWEKKQMEHQRQIELLEREMEKMESSGRDLNEEVGQLDLLHLDDELDVGRQQEKMLQSELTLLRSKLSNCETELLQCKNKIRLLMDDISEDRRWRSKEEEERKHRERLALSEIDDLQSELQQIVKDYDLKVKSCDKLEIEVRNLESAISIKKKQVESLVQEMKAANLESLALTPAEEIRNLLEGGCHKGPGSSRKIVGSPRQLENAVPTSKNPHGVWV